MKKALVSKPQTTSLSQTMDGKDYSVQIREISNGYIIKQSISYRDEKDNYHYKTKETYSKTSPLASMKSDNDGDEGFDFADVDLSTFEEGY